MIEAYRATGDAAILDSAKRQADQLIEMLLRQKLRLHDTGTPQMNGLPSMSIIKPIVILYELTGDMRHLDFVREKMMTHTTPSPPQTAIYAPL